MQAFIRPAKIFTSFVTKVTYQPGKGDRNLLFGARRELLKTGSISRLRASYQQLDSESDNEKQAPFATLGKGYPIRKRYVNLALASGFIDIAHHFIGYCFPDEFCEATT